MPLIQPNKIHKLFAVPAIILGATLAQTAISLPEDRLEPLQIEAEHNTGDINGNLIYEGNVVITQGSLNLKADKVVAQTNQQTISCSGTPATFQLTTKEYGLVTGQAQELYFDRSSGKLKLSKDAIITKQDGSFTQGTAITYNIDNETWTVEGGVTVLPPAVTKEGTDGDS